MYSKKSFSYFAFFASISIVEVLAYGNATATVPLDRRAASGCTPGSYSSSGTCYQCMAGSYSTGNDATVCTSARAGYYVPTAGATAESTCTAGTYSGSVGSTACSPCTPGHQCPNDALASPQACSAGRYSTGGNVIACPSCSPGYFNNIQGATGCCPCCAGYFNGNAGNTNCQSCGNQYPYSDPGTASQGQCSAQMGLYAPASSCNQDPSGTCPTSSAYATKKSRRQVRHRQCMKANQKSCPVYGMTKGRKPKLTAYECVDVQSDLESCGGCADPSNMRGEPSLDGGRDCSAIPQVSSVQCQRGLCVVGSCRSGFVPSKDKGRCVLEHSLRKPNPNRGLVGMSHTDADL